jgi:hypothetical protein
MVELRHWMWMLGIATAAVAFIFLVSRLFGDYANIVFALGGILLMALPFFAADLYIKLRPVPKRPDKEPK